MLKAYVIDENRYYKEDFIYENENQEFENNIITQKLPNGFYKPKWDGSKWIESATIKEIEKSNFPTQENNDLQLKINAQLLKGSGDIKIELENQKKINASLLMKIAKGGI